MTDVWSDRAEAYRTSSVHASGEDLDLVIEWCEPAAGVAVLDVATGGGHVARRLRELGATVVTVDPAPGMKADSTAPAEALPFADGSFDAVACRLAAHHFVDVRAAVKEMARVAKQRVVICDNTFVSEASEQADRPARPESRSQLRCRRVAFVLRARRARGRRRAFHGAVARDRAVARARRLRRVTRPRVCASCSETASSTAWMQLPTLVLRGRKAA